MPPGQAPSDPRLECAGSTAGSVLGECQPQFAVALGIVAPVLSHLDEQEEVHGLLEDLRELPARLNGDLADHASPRAKHDGFLAVPLDKNGLLDAHTPWLLLPGSGLH